MNKNENMEILENDQLSAEDLENVAGGHYHHHHHHHHYHHYHHHHHHHAYRPLPPFPPRRFW